MPHPHPPGPRPVALLASGTLGDVAPMAALGAALAAAGVPARLVAPPPFAGLAARHGLPFAPLEGDLTPLLHADPAALTLRDGPLGAARATARFLRAARPLYARMLASAWESCAGSRAVLAGLPAWWGLEIAEALGVPGLLAPLQPVARTRAWPSALLPLLPWLPGAANLLSHRLLELGLRAPWRAELTRWRRAALRRSSRRDLLGEVCAGRAPALCGWSALVAPPPPDWPAAHVICGYWRAPAAEEPPLPDALARFLDAGPPPVLVGFGGMGAGDPSGDARLALEALALAGRRGVLVGGEEAARLAAGRADVCVVAAAPHARLLPHVAAAVHHGGAGTTGASLAAGAPTAAVPFAADQRFWGWRVAALGAGPPPAPRRSLDAARLAALIAGAAGTPAYRLRAAALGERLRAERGLERAVEAVARLLR